ncbi:transmembrane protein 71 [Rana temporaria]|uniref:transmembrane protein 71 n=1 Tax=Rana temporaria TaxID=8407 RepID=UPI001AACB8E8|nr:transmembrane protein 71 [Rana temporaria]XP_040210919.1 transmembrane protein 71 [Rana temporaria]
MDGKSPAMSTPKKGRYSTLFKELARLPSILFGHYSRDTCDLLKFDTPNKSFLPTLDASPCRHSPRLLSNGYYAFEEDSYNTDDEGNLSFSPTKCTISYKENIVRIFRRRRRPHAQRALDLSNHENQDRWRPQLDDELGDCEPLDFVQTFNNYAGRITACTSRSIIGPSLAASFPQVLQSEQSNLKEHRTSQPSQDTGSLSSIYNSESRTLIPVISSPSKAQVEEILEKSSTYGSVEEHSCINKGNNTFSDDTKNLIPAQQKTIPLSLIGSVEDISETEPDKARQEKNVSIAVFYIGIFIFFIVLCAR